MKKPGVIGKHDACFFRVFQKFNAVPVFKVMKIPRLCRLQPVEIGKHFGSLGAMSQGRDLWERVELEVAWFVRLWNSNMERVNGV